GLTDEQIKKNLLFTGEKVGDLMTIAMTPQDAKKWFGAAPPDLSVIARAKSTTMGPSGVDYVYTFLRTFYRDSTKATGWNNLVFPSVGMPNPFWQMEGPRSLNHVTVHQVEKEGGSLQWERTVAKYDTQGFADIKTEELADYRGGPQDKAVLESADPKRVAVFD